jgi:alkylation response protein AidB-like acyl-CoA dehydrogenase
MIFNELQAKVASIAHTFAADRPARQLRRHLERADFDQLREAGLPLVALPVDAGGLWQSVAESTRPICQTLRTLARGDSSVALVCAMHPAVLSYWLTAPAELAERSLWRHQCQDIFSSVRDGHWWGTITSEPGSGGDITRSRTEASHGEGETSYFITGKKHFGSGSGIMSFMVTTALPEGSDLPEWFFIDLRDVPWDSSQGVTLIAEWDGHGMIATQSHSLAFNHFPATRMAWSHSLLPVAGNAGGFIGCLFTSVIVGIVDEAIATARTQLAKRELGAFEQSEWTRVKMEHWLIEQAFGGMLRAIETGPDARREVLIGKTAIAELSETALTRLGRLIGGSTLDRRSPFGFWLNDVRALGFLRPPWPLAFKTLEDTAAG